MSALRCHDWPERLSKVIHEWQQLPFIWGQTDCAHFADAVLVALTKKSALSGWLSYYGPGSAHRTLQQAGFQNLAAAVSSILGSPIPPVHLQRGDLVMVRHGLGVLLDHRIAVRAQKSGLLFLPCREITLGWKI
jgi:hypothetical protein